MIKLERKAIDCFCKNYTLIFFVLISGFALIIRFIMFSFESHDYIDFLSPWFDYLRKNGGLFALKNYPGDYNAPYMTVLALLSYLPFKSITLIKAFSCVFDYALSFSCGLLAVSLTDGSQKRKRVLFLTAYSVVLMLPTVCFNSAMWAQCDSVYTTFIILSLLFLVKERHTTSFVFLGISFAFKFQFVFILPLYIVLYFAKKRFSVLNFLIIPLVNIIMCLPAVMFGNSLSNILGIYLRQPKQYKEATVYNFPNIYNIVNGASEILYTAGVIFTVSVCMLMLLYVIYKKVEFNDEKIITLGLWFVLIITFVLPGIHERYAFCGEILAVIVFICFRKYRTVAVCTLILPLITYSKFLFGLKFDYFQPITLLYFAVLIYFTASILRLLADSKNIVNNSG